MARGSPLPKKEIATPVYALVRNDTKTLISPE